MSDSDEYGDQEYSPSDGNEYGDQSGYDNSDAVGDGSQYGDASHYGDGDHYSHDGQHSDHGQIGYDDQHNYGGQYGSVASCGSDAGYGSAAVGPHHEHTAFGDYDVCPDTYPQTLNPASNAIRESEFHTLQTAWENIHHGKGLDIQGSCADVATFDDMLRDGLQHSAAFRKDIEDIGTDTAHTEHVKLGHSQPYTFSDGFKTDNVDLTDLSRFPAQPRAGHHNEVTRTELIDHILDERHYARQHNPLNSHDPGAAYPPAHRDALDHQNRVRDELGQSHVDKQSYTLRSDGKTMKDFDFKLEGGDVEHIDFDGKNDPSRITLPRDHHRKSKPPRSR